MIDPVLTDRIVIDAPVAVVWAAVGDVRRMPEWSPQVESVRLRRGHDEVALGAEFTNANREGEVTWITHARVVRFEPERAIAFQVAENWLVWTYALEDLGDGRTELTIRREGPDGVNAQAAAWAEANLGGLPAFNQTMISSVRATLERLKESVES